MRELRAQGLRRCDIAEAMGIPEQRLRKKLRRLGFRFHDDRELREAKHNEATTALIARVKKLAAAGHTRGAIAAILGLSEHALHARLQRIGLSVTALGAKPKPPPRRVAKPRETTDENRLKRNPKLTVAQQEQVDRHKNRMWRTVSPKLAAMPTPTRDEADALVREFLARGGQVKVAPGAVVVIPCNAGMKWR